jgi:ribonuclease HI
MHQIKKQLLHPNLHRHHIQGDVLQSTAKAIRQSPSLIHFYNVKSHAGIIDNEYADALARKSITTCSGEADTSIRYHQTVIKQQGLRVIPSITSTG